MVESSLDEDKDQALLFVYGTLLRGFENAPFLGSPDKAVFFLAGKIPCALYDLGPFPAILKPAEGKPGEHCTHGEIYQVNDPLVLFETLDLIEGYNHQHPQRSLYIREKITADTREGPKEVWAYFYNQPLENAVLIESGNYRDYIAGKI